MAMVVKNNMSAVSTLNTLNKNSKALQKSLTKVSSGMKINSAQDDASGYAISERMRVQIRSLDQANQNTQNGSSMMKTAEGAVSSTVEILKSLKEKAINAANDTNTDSDRTTIQKEIDQFVDQIDDNALVTFNGKYLVDGSKTFRGVATKTAMTNQSLDEETKADSTLTSLKNRNGENLEIASTDRVTASFVKNGVTYATTYDVGNTTLQKIFENLNTAGGGNVFGNQQLGAAPSSGSGSASSTTQDMLDGVTAKDAATLTGTEIRAFIDAVDNLSGTDYDTVDASSIDKSVLKGILEYTADSDAKKTALKNQLAGQFTTGQWATNRRVGFSMDGSTSTSLLNDNTAHTVSQTQAEGFADTVIAAVAGLKNTVTDFADVKVGLGTSTGNALSITTAAVNGYNSTREAGTQTGDNAVVTTNAQNYLRDLMLEDAITKANTLTTTKTTSSAGAAPAASSGGTSGPMVATGSDIGASYSNDMVTTADGTNGITVTAAESGIKGQISGLTISVADSEGNVKKSVNAALDAFKTTIFAVNENNSNTSALHFQVGAEANQAITVGLNDMRSEALGLKSSDGAIVSVATQEKANAAVAAFDNAIQKALDEQTKIGAIEARLDYTSQNLTTSSENVQAAESTIRDSDMAKEMTNYTKNNVLLQAAQSMLAQANQSSSAVLSLLQ